MLIYYFATTHFSADKNTRCSGCSYANTLCWGFSCTPLFVTHTIILPLLVCWQCLTPCLSCQNIPLQTKSLIPRGGSCEWLTGVSKCSICECSKTNSRNIAAYLSDFGHCFCHSIFAPLFFFFMWIISKTFNQQHSLVEPEAFLKGWLLDNKKHFKLN